MRVITALLAVNISPVRNMMGISNGDYIAGQSGEVSGEVGNYYCCTTIAAQQQSGE